MKKIFNKTSIAILVVSLFLGFGAGAYSYSVLKQMLVFQDKELKVTVSGKNINQTSEDGIMYPILYQGHSYISAKALSEALGATIKYNADSKTVEIVPSNKANVDISVKDNEVIDIKPVNDNKISQPRPNENKNNMDDIDKDRMKNTFNKGFNKGFNKNEVSDNLKPQIAIFMNEVIKATKSGDNSNLDKLIYSIVVDKNVDNILLGTKYSVDSIHLVIENYRKDKNDASLTEWANGNITNFPNLIKYDANVNENDTITFTYLLPSSHKIYTQAIFKHPNINSDKYVLESITIGL